VKFFSLAREFHHNCGRLECTIPSPLPLPLARQAPARGGEGGRQGHFSYTPEIRDQAAVAVDIDDIVFIAVMLCWCCTNPVSIYFLFALTTLTRQLYLPLLWLLLLLLQFLQLILLADYGTLILFLLLPLLLVCSAVSYALGVCYLCCLFFTNCLLLLLGSVAC
jgi:hypothetical protein